MNKWLKRIFLSVAALALIEGVGLLCGHSVVKAAGDGFLKLAALTVGTAQYPAAAGTAGNVITSDGTNFVSSAASALPNGPSLNGFRLTLTTGVPVTSANVTAAATVYFTPYTGNTISLFDGAATWSAITSAEVSIALAGLTSGLPYDVFVYNNSGTLTIDTLVAWTDLNTRATALALQNGVYVKTGATTRLYVGTLFTTGTATTEDTAARRYLWNAYHRVEKRMLVQEATNSWTYTTATFRQANGSTANEFAYVQGLSYEPIRAHIRALAAPSALADFVSGIGIDSATANSAQMMYSSQAVISRIAMTDAWYHGYPGIGRHKVVWEEYAEASGTCTWYGDAGVTYLQTGMEGWGFF